MILQPIKRNKPPDDDSSIGIRLGLLLLLALVLFGVLAFRLWYLQILMGDTYSASATSTHESTVVVEAPRGVIYDSDGDPLVENRAGLSVELLPMDMPDPDDEPEMFYREIFDLAELLGMSDADLLDSYQKAAKSPSYLTRVVKEDVPEDTVVAYLEEHAQEFPGVTVDKTSLRQYPFKALATHLLGYVGEISKGDVDSGAEFPHLVAGAHVGRDGVERTYDRYLRGTDGHKTVEVNAQGLPVRFLEDQPAEAGFNLFLTIDADLQRAAEDALVEGIQRAHAEGKTKAAGGAVVALDPRTGKVLAMASYPDYDPSIWVGSRDPEQMLELNTDVSRPQFNRAIDGLYPAGSTFKPFVAAVGLDAGVVTPETLVDCHGEYRVGAQTWKDWLKEGHGNGINLAQAIMQSCDVYFYTLGKEMYDQPTAVLQEGLKRKFGFGAPTGIDLPGETTGSRVPDKTWARERGQEWKTGDEINLAIGQGDLLVTPLQLAVNLAAIVNKDNVLWVPRLALQITDSSGTVVRQFTSERKGQLDIGVDPLTKQSYLSDVRRGMRLVTSDPMGTAYNIFQTFPISVGGKTGTAQKGSDDDYALFMGYAPADGNGEPEIVVVAIIEQGGHGSSVAAPVVRRVMEAYFDQPRGVIPLSPTEDR
jgi:penicillin-binding protein 2